MSHHHLVLPAFLVLVVSSGSQAAAPAPVKYEYGVLTVTENRTGDVRIHYSWEDGGGVVKTNNHAEFYEKLTGRRDKKEVTLAEVLNALGQNGWFMVTSHTVSVPTTRQASVTQYIFRRP